MQIKALTYFSIPIFQLPMVLTLQFDYDLSQIYCEMMAFFFTQLFLHTNKYTFLFKSSTCSNTSITRTSQIL